MIQKIKSWIVKVSPKIKDEYCYSDMEYVGVAAFGCCAGNGSGTCKSCSHWKAHIADE